MIQEALERIQKKIPSSWGEIDLSKRNGSYYLYAKRSHDKKTNRVIGAKDSLDFYTAISFGSDVFFSIDGEETLPITYSISFYWYDENEDKYPFSMPSDVKTLKCPRSIHNKYLCIYDNETGRFLGKRNKEVDVINLIEKEYNKFMLPTKFWRGIPSRVSRFLSWSVLYYFFVVLVKLARVMVFIASGKVIKIEGDSKSNYYLMDEVLKKKLTLVEKEVKKIDFYGTKVNLVPLVTYSILHLGLYVYNFFLGNLPKVFVNLFSARHTNLKRK